MEQARELGANEYCIKPVDADKYRSAIEGIVERWLHAAGVQSVEGAE